MLNRIGLVLMVVVLVTGSAHAGVKPGDSVLIVNVGYASGKSSITGENIDGGIFGIDFQKLDFDSQWSGGISIGYGQINSTVAVSESTESSHTITSVPIFLGGKYWIGDGEKRIQGYVGLAFGMYFAQLETSLKSTAGREDFSGSYESETGLGIGLGIPVGVAVSLGESLMLTANYTLNWLFSNEFLENDILNTVSLGVAFTY